MILKNTIFSKGALERLFVPAMILFVGLSAFALGRLSALEGQRGVLKVHEPAGAAGPGVQGAPAAAALALPHALSAAGQESGVYVASKNGTKYYLPSCSGAKRIKEENKIWFETKGAAQAAGFGPASNCPGL